MGVYSSNRTQLGMYNSDEIVANENYYGVVGACQMIIEGYENDQAIFESVLATDFMEAVAVQEGAVETSVINEATVSEFIDKIREVVVKMWEKIKGLFQSFIVKLNNVVIRDNKKFVEKYKKAVQDKKDDLTKMKYKWSEPKQAGFDKLEEALSVEKVIKVMNDCSGEKNGTEENLKKVTEKIQNGDYLKELLDGIEPKEYSKKMHEECFGDEKEEEGLSSSRLTECIDILENKTLISDIQDTKKECDKAFAKMLKCIDNAKKFIKDSKKEKSGVTGTNHVYKDKDEDGNDIKKYDYGYATGNEDAAKETNSASMYKLNVMQKAVSVGNTAISKIAGVYLTETKFKIKQARRVFAQAAAFNPKAVKENALLVEAVGDVAEYEVESSFNDYEM